MPERYPPDDPREWLNRAHSNIILAKNVNSTMVYLEDLCYNATGIRKSNQGCMHPQ